MIAEIETGNLTTSEIRDRRERTTKFGATGDETRARDQHADYARMGKAA